MRAVGLGTSRLTLRRYHHLGASGLRGPNAETGLRGPNAETGLRGPNAEAGPAATADPRLTFASTAHVAALLDAPVLLVLDATATSGSVAPVVHGFATWAPGVHIGGVILNRVGSDTHEAMLRAAMAPTGVPVLGAVRR